VVRSMTETTSDQTATSDRNGATTIDSATRSPLVGMWLNELGSRLQFDNPTRGSLTGTYTSSVGSTQQPQPLTGYYLRQRDGSAVIGFAVRWTAADSLATWTGRFEPDGDRITATWVLESGATPSTAWRATRLGHDEFNRLDGPLSHP
jgi:hypothetical protein